MLNLGQLGRALALAAERKAKRPDEAFRINREHVARVLEARRIEAEELPLEERLARRLERLGYEPAYGYDADLGDWAEIRINGRVVARVARARNQYEALLAAARELGEAPA